MSWINSAGEYITFLARKGRLLSTINNEKMKSKTRTFILATMLQIVQAVLRGDELMEMIRLCNTHQDYHDCRNIPAAYVSRYQNHPRLQFTRSYSNCEHQCCACQMHSLWLSPENLVRAYTNVTDRNRFVEVISTFF